MQDNVETLVALTRECDLPIAFGVNFCGSLELLAKRFLEFECRWRMI